MTEEPQSPSELAEYLWGRPIDMNERAISELIRGIELEQVRLANRRFLLTLHQRVYGIDGLTEFVYLIEGFDNQREAERFTDAQATSLLCDITARPDKKGEEWNLESEGDVRFYFRDPPKRNLFIRVVFDRTFKVRGSIGEYDTAYYCFRVVGPFSGQPVGVDLIDFLDAEFELSQYFQEVSKAAAKGYPLPRPARSGVWPET